jgi:hypothetical protein
MARAGDAKYQASAIDDVRGIQSPTRDATRASAHLLAGQRPLNPLLSIHSVDAMEKGLVLQKMLWQSPSGTILDTGGKQILYNAFLEAFQPLLETLRKENSRASV